MFLQINFWKLHLESFNKFDEKYYIVYRILYLNLNQGIIIAMSWK